MIPEAHAPAPGGAGSSDLVEVGVYPTEREAAEHGLVILAMRSGYWIERTPAGFSLRVPAAVGDEARHQLSLYDRESFGWPPRLRPLARLRLHWPVPLAWAATTALIYHLQGDFPGHFEAFGALRGDALFAAGEWWRPITALLLHADLGHLVSNLGAGVFMFALVLGGLGVARGGLALLAAAIAGNVAAAALHPSVGYASIGASTAVFAALGMLTGAAIREVALRSGRFSWRALLLPLLAGGALLALYGAGGMRTDVVAHATGFVAGLLLGATVSPGARRRRTQGGVAS